MKRLVLAVLAVFILAGIASAQTTMTLNGIIRVYPEMNNYTYSKQSTDQGYRQGYGVKVSSDSKNSAFVDQRARLFFNLKSGDNVGGTVAFEVDSRWGDMAYRGGARNYGGALQADTINIETKNVYMWFKPSEDLKLTLGIQGYTDDFKGVILGGADMAGIRADYSLSKDSSLLVGFYLWGDKYVNSDGTNYKYGNDGIYFIPVTYKQKIGDGNLGVSFYTIQDNAGSSDQPIGTAGSGLPSSYGSANLYYLGANYTGKAGDISYYAGLLYNFGTFNKAPTNDIDVSAFILNADATMKLGAGKFKAALLYASGDKSNTDFNGIVTGNQYANGADLPLMQNDLYLILRTLDDISHSEAFFTDLRNGGAGATVVYVTYDQNLSDKLNVQAALGYGKYNEEAAPGITPAITEINAQAAYKFDKALTIKAALAYGILSDVKDSTSGKDADNLYRAMLKFQYAF